MGRLYIGQNHRSNPSPVKSIFRLVGKNEDALTFALGYLLANSPSLCTKLMRVLGVKLRPPLEDDYSVHLQEVTEPGFGRRDIVIEIGDKMRAVLEAKVGGAEPSVQQLTKYAKEKNLWGSFRTRVIAALTQVKLPESKAEKVRSELSSNRIQFCEIQWHAIVDLVLQHSTHHESEPTKYLFGEFIRYVRSDYRMGYYDAEVLIQDVNPLNKDIFENAWMYVTDVKDKRAPLYFAPYFTKQGVDSGLIKLARVAHSEEVVLAKLEAIVEGLTEEHRDRWGLGLRKLRERAESEGFADRVVRLLYLDRPIIFRSTPLNKKEFNSTNPSKRIPNQIPKGFSLGFDDLLKQDYADLG